MASWMTGHGVSSRSSHSAAAGRTTPSAKPCTQSRTSRWSSESSREKAAGAAASGAVGAGAVSVMRVGLLGLNDRVQTR